MTHFKNKAKGSASTTILGSVIIAVLAVYYLAKLATSGYYSDVAETTPSATETRIMPSGRLTVGDGTEPGQRTGQQVFDKICIQCHGATSSIAFAPKVTHNDQWAARISQGLDVLVQHATDGFQGPDGGVMPAKGGAADLTVDEIKRAVIYMANQSGANFSESAPAAATASASAPAAASDTSEASKSEPAKTEEKPKEQVAISGKGKETFEASCKACHGADSPIPGAPKVSKKDEWAPRIKQGEETLFKHALEGFNGSVGMMPAKGGNSMLPDEDVRAAVQYMVNQSK